MKTKFFGMAVAVAFLAFSLASCSNNANKNANTENANAKSATATETAATAPMSGSHTITGEILDMSCYMDKGAKGSGHKKCAEACLLKKKLPAGILDKDGKVYILLEDHDAEEAYQAALHHAAETISITGNVVVKNGIPSLIVEKVDAGATAES